MYLAMHIYIEDMRTKKALFERNIFSGFRWYLYFVAQEQLVAFEASK